MRVGLFLLAAFAVITWLLPATAVAQDGEPVTPAISVIDQAIPASAEAADAAEPFDGRATEATVIRVRRTLVGIAAATTVGLMAFWWHTAPSRRLRIATQRAADRVMGQD